VGCTGDDDCGEEEVARRDEGLEVVRLGYARYSALGRLEGGGRREEGGGRREEGGGRREGRGEGRGGEGGCTCTGHRGRRRR
jgi:hypothetical protein